MRGRGKYPILNRIMTSIENPSDFCSVCKSLLFDVLQKTSPYISPRGTAVPGGLILEQPTPPIQQTSPWTVGTPTWSGTEDSVRCQARDKQQQSGGWI